MIWVSGIRPSCGTCDFCLVKAAFAAAWNEEDLLVSFDGGGMFRPWAYNLAWLTRGDCWYHTDQSPKLEGSRGRVCVQGLVTLCDATPQTGGLVVVPGSHIHHETVCARAPDDDDGEDVHDFVAIPLQDPILEGGGRLVCASAGDLILWDSRTIHCNTCAVPEPDEGRARAFAQEVDARGGPWELIRQVGYICMTPRSLAAPGVIEKRTHAFVTNHGTSHWPHKLHDFGAPVLGTPDKDPALISREQRALIGYLEI
mmetsp:Transcript_75860/g.245661  ORF Transcript_75860/g.245661 Transcript_75860/m.245661 type:complete len:256 (-) Transcript_75860:199-966(-)